MDEVLAMLQSFEYISFDLFDTALLRTVLKPVDLFFLLGVQQQTLLGDLTPRQFQSMRTDAENQARAAIPGEVTLDDIYDQLGRMKPLQDNHWQQIKQAEIGLELRSTVPNPVIQAVYKASLDQQKCVLFLTDIYLPREAVERLLRQHGYGIYSKLYVSSELRAAKRDGSLYKHVLSELNLKPEQLLHIGDNPKSDIARASELGIQTYHYHKSADVARKHRDPIVSKAWTVQDRIGDSQIGALLVNRLYAQRPPQTAEQDFWYWLGYGVAGPLYYAFTHWLLERAQQDQIARLYFLSRDGYILEQVFARFAEHTGVKLPHRYLYASRRALNIPLVTSLDDLELEFLLSGRTKLTVNQYLGRIDLNPADYQAQIEAAGFHSGDHVVVMRTEREKMEALLRLLEADILARAAEERGYLARYLEQERFYQDGRIGLVDIGWRGTFQRAYKRLGIMLSYQPDLHGYYFGTFRSKFAAELQISSYLVHLGEPQAWMRFVWEAVELLEFFMFAPHGSVLHFREHEGEIVPEFAHEPEADHQYRRDGALRIQQGGLDFVDDLLCTSGLVAFSPHEALHAMERLLFNPTALEAAHIGELKHVESFGGVYAARYLAKPSDAPQILLNPYALYRDYEKSYWKSGYLKRSRAPYPYKLLLRFMRNAKRAVTRA